jgi:polygalacturonase
MVRMRGEQWIRAQVSRAALLSLLATAAAANAQDTRNVSEPHLPATCAVLRARLAAPRGVLSAADEAAPDTRRVQAAIDACTPGSAVRLEAAGSKNVFLSAPLRLRPGVTLWVASGTTLFASRNPRDYDVTPGSCGVVAERRQHCQPLILAEHAPGSGVMGDGAIDGRGGTVLLQGQGLRGKSRTWWELAKEAKIKDQFQSCPGLIVARSSNDFTLYRITLRNSPNLHVAVHGSNGFTAWAVKIKTPQTARNTDGINPHSSSNVTIAHCAIDTGDDNVAIKAGAEGPASHITIAHNHFYAGHGMSIGSDTSGGVSAVRVSDLTLDGTDHGLRIKSDRSRGGLVQDISYEDVCIRNVGNPILLDTRYTRFEGEKIPVYRDIRFKNVSVLTPGGLALLGFDEQHRIGVSLDNVHVAACPGCGVQQDVRAAHAEVTLGPRRGNFTPAGADVSLTDRSLANAAAVTAPALDCSGRFVPFPEQPAAPAAATKVPPPDPTLYVAASGSGDYYSIQRAIDRAPATGAVISIGPGTYRERLVIDKPHIVLTSPYRDPSRTQIVADASSAATGDTFTTATVEVKGADFRAENLTFVNEFNRTHEQKPQGSQALALSVWSDRAIFRNMRFIGDQDTLYAGSSDCSPPGHAPVPCTLTRQYFEDCFIEGNVDFIFGNSLAVFEHCELHSNSHSIGYLTAQGKQHPDEQSLFVFNRARLTADAGVAHVWLGRPWRPRASVVFLRSEMGAHIEPAGFREWHPGETDYMGTVSYAEYASSGPGAHTGQRDPHVQQLSAEQAARYDARRILRRKDNWDPTVRSKLENAQVK